MNRQDAQKTADRVATLLALLEDEGRDRELAGARQMAIQIAPMVAAQGFVEVPIWLAMCGIYPAGREKTFRGNPKLTPWDRVQEAMDAGRWPASKSVELKKAG